MLFRSTVMQLGFVTAILPDLSFEDVLRFAADEDYDCVEVMCWPSGGPRSTSVSIASQDNSGQRSAVREKGTARSSGSLLASH